MYNIFAIIHRHQRSQKKLFMHTEMQEKKSKTTQDAPPNQSEIWNRERARQRIYKKWKKLLSNSVCVRLSINLIQFSFFFCFCFNIFLFLVSFCRWWMCLCFGVAIPSPFSYSQFTFFPILISRSFQKIVREEKC